MRRLNRALRMLRSVSAVLVRAKREDELLDEVCRVLVQDGRYDAAAIAFIAPEPLRYLQIVAKAGEDRGYFAQHNPVWEEAGEQNSVDCGRISAAIRGKRPWSVSELSATMDGPQCVRDLGALGFTSLVILPLTDGERAFGTLALLSRQTNILDEEEAALVRQAADDLAYGIGALRNDIRRTEAEREALRNLERLSTSMESAIEAIALTVEKRDPYTAGHQRKVAELAAAIGREMGLSSEQIHGLRLGAIIHDIGKIYIPAEILNRPGKLSEHEFALVKTHAQVGYDIIKNVDFAWPVALMVRHHHERLDGSGYPDGLKGEDIVLEARILAVADVVEAITAHRPYRAALGMEAGVHALLKGRGTIFDARAVDACLRVLRDGVVKLGEAQVA